MPEDLADARQELRADCSRCQGLCCVAPAFARSADFAIDKPAGHPCPNLRADSRCGIHAQLRESGFPGCTVFDCFGAGQQVVQVAFAGRDWRQSPETAAAVFTVFGVVRQLKEVLWYLAEARAVSSPGPLRVRVEDERRDTLALVDAPADELARVDGAAVRARVGPLLAEVSEAARAGVPGRGRDRVGADLVGSRFRGAALRGVSLRGAYLLGADLRGADLDRTDLLGADLRGADVGGARLADSLFLTQPQLDAARGDDTTVVPSWATRPGHWRVVQDAGRRRR